MRNRAPPGASLRAPSELQALSSGIHLDFPTVRHDPLNGRLGLVMHLCDEGNSCCLSLDRREA